MVCRDCGIDFDKKHLKIGYINQCDHCSRNNTNDARIKYLGRPGATHKGANIEIFRTNLDTVSAIIRRENCIGPTANINLSSAAQIAAQERWKAGENE